MLAVCPSMIARAEAKAAPRFFADFTDGNTVSVSEFVTRLDWSSPDRARQAAVWARTLDIADADRLRDRSPRAWSNMVCILVAVYLSEFQPAFARASREARRCPGGHRVGRRQRARGAAALGLCLVPIGSAPSRLRHRVPISEARAVCAERRRCGRLAR